MLRARVALTLAGVTSLFKRQVRKRLPTLPTSSAPDGPVAYLDIETTGLWARRHHVTVVGIATATPRGRKLEQFFVHEPRAEADVLEQVLGRLREVKRVVVYNGISFDLPFLRERARKHRMTLPWLEACDLLPLARGWRRRYGAPASCTLQSVLAHFRIHREDRSRGGDVVEAYERWLDDGDETARDLILDHNAEDVLLLPELAARLLKVHGRKRSEAAE